MLESLSNLSADTDSLEVLCAVDSCDPETLQAVRPLTRRFPFTTFFVRERSTNLTVGYYNFLASVSTGKYIQALNDDVVFLTRDWDKLALETLEAIPWKDKVCYGRVRDSLNVSYSCFPVLSRQAYDALGWFFHPQFTGWGADISLFSVFDSVGRVCDLPYSVDHLSHHTGRRERDAVNRHVEAISSYCWGCENGEAMRLKAKLQG